VSNRGDPSAAPDPLSDPATDFVHQLRNRMFALSALFDVLELRGAGSPVVERYLPHLRLELSRLERFAAEWREDVLGDAPLPPASLIDALASAIARVAEQAELRDVLLSLVTEPDAGRVVRQPVLVTAMCAALLDEVVRAIPAGTHVWLAVGGPAGEAKGGEGVIELCASAPVTLVGTGVELARATLRSLGGELGPPAPGRATTLATIRLGASA